MHTQACAKGKSTPIHVHSELKNLPQACMYLRGKNPPPCDLKKAPLGHMRLEKSTAGPQRKKVGATDLTEKEYPNSRLGRDMFC